MNLYVITFRADVVKAGQEKTDHEVILFASCPKVAREKAVEFFAQRGYWVRRYHPATMQMIAGTQPRCIGTREVSATSIFYNGKLFGSEPPFNHESA